MTPKDKQRLKILVLLLLVLGLTFTFAYQMKRPSTASAVESRPQTPPGTAAKPPEASDARIRLDLLQKDPAAAGEVGDTNVFQYRTGRSAATQPGATTDPGGMLPPPELITERPTSITPPPPPPPPPIPLKYNGYADATNGLTAFLTDDQRSYDVSAGDVLMGRYRIVRVTTANVEVEDLEHNRRQVLPLLK